MMVDSAYFRKVGNYDIAPLLGAVDRHSALLKEQTWRQDHPDSAHKDSETIYLRMPSEINVDTVFNSLEVVDLPPMNDSALSEACLSVAMMVDKPIARAMLTNLKSGGVVTPHVDQGAYADATERYHLPIITNDSVIMASGDEMVHMSAGSVWWFNKHVTHSVSNDGYDRIHLIVDVFK